MAAVVDIIMLTDSFHGVAKSQTRLSDFTLTFHFHALEKEMTIHSRVLAWRIPGTGEPGGLPSMPSDTTEATLQQQQQQRGAVRLVSEATACGLIAFPIEKGNRKS